MPSEKAQASSTEELQTEKTPKVSTFSELVLGLSSVALHYLGEIPYDSGGDKKKSTPKEASLKHHGSSAGEADGGAGGKEKAENHGGMQLGQSGGGSGVSRHLDLALKNIDYLDVLSERTRGNLSPSERDLLDNVLSDLKVRYSAQIKAGSSGGL